jgi:hypothetical protein
MRSDRAALQPLPEKLLQKEEEPRDRKAVIALARKFLGIIYRTAKNKWLFEDFPNIALAEATARQLPPTYASAGFVQLRRLYGLWNVARQNPRLRTSE